MSFYYTNFPVQAWTGPDISRGLRLADFKTAHEDGKVSSPTHWPTLPPNKHSWYLYLLEAELTSGP